MQLEYNILWIDNDIQEYIDNGEVGNIITLLEELGFEPNIVTVDDEADLDNHIFTHKYDLIISDFNLNATTGDVIIERIREEKKFSTEILFYSAKSDFRNQPEVKDRLAFMDRITFHSNRDTFLEKVDKMIHLTLDKLLELNATRGLITSATSDLDVEIESLVKLLVEKRAIEKDALDGFVKKKVVEPLEKKLASFWDNYESFDIYFHKIDAIRKWEILRELLKPLKDGSQEITDFLKANATYQDDVIGIRNQFAHAKAEGKEGKTVLKGQLGKDDFEYDTSACIDIRRKLIIHKKNIDILKATLAKFFPEESTSNG